VGRAAPTCGTTFSHCAPTTSIGSRASAAISRAFSVRVVLGHHVAIVLHHDTAAACGDDDRLGAARNKRPPCVDVAADQFARGIVFAQVIRQRAAAAAAGNLDRRDAEPIEHARHRRIDVGCERRLHAALQDQHRARVPLRRPGTRVGGIRDPRDERVRQDRLDDASCRQRGAEQRLGEKALAQSVAARGLDGCAADAFVDDLAADVDQTAVTDTRRARRLATPARQAAIEMQLRLRGDGLALEHLFDQVDPAARPVELVAQQLVRGTRRQAEPAVDARPQDRIGLAALGGIANERRETRFHQNSG